MTTTPDKGEAPLTTRKKLTAWLPLGLWMALLFGISTEIGAPRRTSRILVPLLRWLVPDISPAALDRTHFLVRKAGHALGYAVLAALLWRARRLSRPEGETVSWPRDAAIVLGMAVAFAASDEWHQTFSPSRQGSLSDVLLDAAGAGSALLAIGLRRRWQ